MRRQSSKFLHLHRVLWLSASVLAADAALAQVSPTGAMTHTPKSFQLLTPQDVDPSTLLPPPLTAENPRYAADLDAVEKAYRTRTPERFAQADWDDKHEDATLFQTTLGPAFDLAKLPETAKLLATVENEQALAATLAKRYFKRVRPWAVDPTIKPCDYKPNAIPNTSYPSGHATLGYSVGYVLAYLMPDKAAVIQARASDYAYSRLICGDHFPSDTEASHVLGVTIGVKLMTNPKLAAQIAAARAELRAAGLTGK